MTYESVEYFFFVIINLILYYIFPKKIRWIVLFVGSVFFYCVISEKKLQIAIFLGSVLSSYLFGVCLEKQRKMDASVRRITLTSGILISISPLILSKGKGFLLSSVAYKPIPEWILPIGLSFYSMQVVAYLVDLYRGDIKAQKNIFKYVLTISFFPLIIQGPISRYDQLERQLEEGHNYEIQNIMKGIQLVIWGLFLKYLLADKAAIFVNAVFDNYTAYAGLYVFLAAALYSIQLYTDFLACTTISQGVAEMFGIEIIDNFKHPYFATSIKEFWHRWHMSLSFWFRDYIYIPLGGGKKGKYIRYRNLMMVFVISGIWHGGRWKFIVWGLLHAFYQIVGELTFQFREKILLSTSLLNESKLRKFGENMVTLFFVMIAWVIFRADSLKSGIEMVISMFSTFNLWIFTDNSLFRLGLNQKEFEVLFIAIIVLLVVSFLQEKGIQIRDWFNKQFFIFRWIIYLCAIWSIWIFGTYGYGFDKQDFIYGGF